MSEQHHAFDLLPPDPQGQLFLMMRGRAVECYALYEQSLAHLYAALMGVSLDYAAIAFFRINNARARLGIIERLIHKRHGSAYNIFWNSLRRQLHGFDERRNQIIHWTSVEEISDKGRTSTLAPPNVLDTFESARQSGIAAPKIVLSDLMDFIVRADFYSRLLNMFFLVCSGQIDRLAEGTPDARKYADTWREICQREVIYPPPNTHPLYRKPKAP
jgi:hypothetical protein